MATALMQNDDLSMNRFNPYTWTGTYGVSSDGSHNWQPDGTFTRPYDNTPRAARSPGPSRPPVPTGRAARATGPA